MVDLAAFDVFVTAQNEGREFPIAGPIDNLTRQLFAGEIPLSRFTGELDAMAQANPDLSGIVRQIEGIAFAASNGAGSIAGMLKEMDALAAMGGQGEGARGGRVGSQSMDQKAAQFHGEGVADLALRMNPDLLKGLYSKPKTDHSADSAIKAYDQVIKSAQNRIDQMKVEESVIGMVGAKADSLTEYQNLLSRATDRGRTVTEAQREEMQKLADTYGQVKEQLAALKFQDDLTFQQHQIGRTQDEQRIYSDLRSRGIDITDPSGQALAGIERTTLALQEMKSVTSDALSTFTSDLEHGASAGKAFGDAFVSVLDKIISKLEDSAISSLFSGGSSSGGIFGSLLSSLGLGGGLFPAAPAGPVAFGMSLADWGFAGGGSIHGPGTGTSDSILARLSNGEFVVNADAAKQHRGLLDMINSGVKLPGFALGGSIPGGERGAELIKPAGKNERVGGCSRNGRNSDRIGRSLLHLRNRRDIGFRLQSYPAS